jgi:hypothetical protein
MYEAKAANKNCVRFAADLPTREPSKRVLPNVQLDYTENDSSKPS